MTHTTTVTSRRNSGSYESVFLSVDITSLDNANSENFDFAAEADVNEVLHASVGRIENPQSYVVQPDQAVNEITVEGYGGTDPTATTDVGVVEIRVDGNPSA